MEFRDNIYKSEFSRVSLVQKRTVDRIKNSKPTSPPPSSSPDSKGDLVNTAFVKFIAQEWAVVDCNSG